MLWRRPVALIATTRRAGERGAVGVDGISITVQPGRYSIYRPAWVLWIVGSGGCGHDWTGPTEGWRLGLGQAEAQLLEPHVSVQARLRI